MKESIIPKIIDHASEIIKKIDIDPKSVICTLLFIPVFLVLKRLVVKYGKEWSEYLIDGLMYFLSRYIKQSLASSLSLKRYCKLQLGNESIKFLNIPSSLDLCLDIDKIFVNLTIRYTQEQERDLNHSDFLKIGNRIKVMGDPGSGKSSLIKKVFRNNCQLAIKRSRKAKLPVFVELKNVNPDKIKESDLGRWFYNYIREEVAKNKVYKIQDCFDNYADNKGLLILLDGLDEVSSTNYNKISECINGLSSVLNDLSESNTIVLTMRTQFHQQVKMDFSVNFPHNTFLKPFTPSHIYEFLSRWHFDKNAEQNISRVYKDLTDRPTLREMCSNPLVLSMYVAEDQISKGNISPESRTQFYRKITEELIIKRRLMQKSNIPGSYSSLKEQRERILGRIAYEHLININESGNTLCWKNAILIIMEILNCDSSKANDVFNEIAKETGLIAEERHQETFRFIHLTFCEFLAAFEVAQGITLGWDELLKYHRRFFSMSIEGRLRLIEVIPFAVGLLSRVKREQALFDIAKLNDSTLMSRCFLETKLYNHKTWPAFITNSRKNLLAYKQSDFNEKWLQDLHVFNVVIRDANLSAESMEINQNIDLSEFYESLLDQEKISLSQILSSLARQDAAAVFRLAEIGNINLLKDFPHIIIQNCDQSPFLGLVKEKIIENNSGNAEDWAALLSEAALQKRLVSYTLDDMPYSEELYNKINKDGTYNIWYYKTLVPETFLTQCITLATKSKLDTTITKGLNLLFKIKSPNENPYRMLSVNTILKIAFSLLFILFLYTSMSNMSLNFFITKNYSLFSGICGLVYISICIVISYRFNISNMYRAAINKDTITDQLPDELIYRVFYMMAITLYSLVRIGKKEKETLEALVKLRGKA